MRPQHSWDDVVRVLDHKGQRWTIENLRRAVHRRVRERMAAADLIKRSPRRSPEDRLMTLVAGIAIADPELTLREIAAQLEKLRERPPRGGRQWAASSVKSLLDQARRLGLAVHDPTPGPQAVRAGAAKGVHFDPGHFANRRSLGFRPLWRDSSPCLASAAGPERAPTQRAATSLLRLCREGSLLSNQMQFREKGRATTVNAYCAWLELAARPSAPS
jgi:hypothetical protein